MASSGPMATRGRATSVTAAPAWLTESAIQNLRKSEWRKRLERDGSEPGDRDGVMAERITSVLPRPPLF
ncbi:hypothetical protein GCM10010206_17680 [Streptomyces cinerochromogenes]|nr:hypothetical protein GCM10010206_17680 [Streptomyces cinerochromogenes]